MTPLIHSAAPAAVNSSSRYWRRCSSVDSSLMPSKRFLMVPVLSSAARMPLFLATIALAMRASSLRFIVSPPASTGRPATHVAGGEGGPYGHERKLGRQEYQIGYSPGRLVSPSEAPQRKNQAILEVRICTGR